MLNFYLKPNVIAEPLVWNWYATSYLIPPAAAAMTLVDRYIKIMKSYIQSPQIHEQAMKSPELMGGPFIDLNGEKVDEVKTLLEKTQKEAKALVSFSADIKAFNQRLQQEEGNTLEGLYAELPESLKGIVELVYDLSHHASIRFIEPLIYQRHYDSSGQAIALSIAESDWRPFIMSTPNLHNEHQVVLNIPFHDERLDILFKMRHTPQPLDHIIEMLEIPEEGKDLFSSLFTTVAPERSHDCEYHREEGVRIRYFGHACVLFQTSDVSILVDPIISYKVKSDVPRFTFEDLPETIDYVLLTHNHQDHVLIETLLQLRHKIKHIVCPANNKGFLADPSLKLMLETIGFTSVYSLGEFETLDIPGGEILGLPFLGEHSDLNVHSKIAHHVSLRGRKFLLAADSNNLDPELYTEIFKRIGFIDMLFVGMECDGAPLTWLYGSFLTHPIKRKYDNARTLSGSNFEKAWSIVQKSGCKEAYVYAMGGEPWLHYIMALTYQPDSIQILESTKFVKKCIENNISSERLFGKREWMV
jgi:L-ascorbate metabolism protein UlaG (beta-lactamase superfamily)